MTVHPASFQKSQTDPLLAPLTTHRETAPMLLPSLAALMASHRHEANPR